MSEHEHIYKPFDAELRSLKDMVLAMGGLVEAHISDAVKALIDRDATRAQAVIDVDRQVNQMELAIDELCIRMLALRQPAGSDLRFIAAALKIVTDLERIGDLAVNMAERAIQLSDEPPLEAIVDLPRMATAVQGMLRGALDAFVTRDADKAEKVLAADDEIDAAMRTVFNGLVAEMKKNPELVPRAIASIFFAKHLERLADHTTNVAEMVIYLVRGQDIRHARNR